MCQDYVGHIQYKDDQKSCSGCYIYFLPNLMGLFNEALKKLECNDANCTELDCIMEGLLPNLKRRKDDKFYGCSVQAILCNLSLWNRRKFEEETDKAL